MKYITVKPVDPAAEQVDIHFDGFGTIRLSDKIVSKLLDALNGVYFDFESARIEIEPSNPKNSA